jgi:ABC-2 type transport system permease protein
MTIALDTAPATEVTDLRTELRSGAAYWWRSYLLMTRWELLSIRLELPLFVILQFMLGAGMALGFGFLFEDPRGAQALYLSTGATVIPMMMVGLVVLPQTVAQQKIEGTYQYLFGLPVPRMCMYLAGLTVWTLVALPSSIAALLVGAWRYDLNLSVDPLVVPATLLTIAVSAAIGYAFAHGLPNPRVTHVLTQLLVFVLVMFSPINFPADRLPGWLEAAHAWLPPQHAATLMRATLTEGLVDETYVRSFAILGAWTVGCWVITAWVMSRRG